VSVGISDDGFEPGDWVLGEFVVEIVSVGVAAGDIFGVVAVSFEGPGVFIGCCWLFGEVRTGELVEACC
jgi:hypothetical protein